MKMKTRLKGSRSTAVKSKVAKPKVTKTNARLKELPILGSGQRKNIEERRGIRFVAADVRSDSALDSVVVFSPMAQVLAQSLEKGNLVHYMMNGDQMLFHGDHIVVLDESGNEYYALIRDFWFAPDGSKHVALQWLLPRPETDMNLKPNVLGPIHIQAEPITVIKKVFYSPLNTLIRAEGCRGTLTVSDFPDVVEMANILCGLF